MDYFIVGDPHVTLKSLDKAHKLFEIAESQGKPVIWLGDLLDTKEVIRGKCLNAWYDYLAKSKRKHKIIVGNHDWFNLQCEDHSLRVFASLPNVEVVDQLTDLGEGLYAIPYIHDQEELNKVLKSIPKGSTLIGHLEVASLDFGNGHICEDGMDIKSLKKFKRVISGHFHKYQVKDNLTYLGTPFSHSFGESNQEKFFGILNVEEDSLELVPSTFPRHITLNIDCDDDTPAPKYNEGDIYRVILSGKQDNINSFRASTTFPPEVVVLERATDSATNDLTIDEDFSVEKQFQVWAEDVKELDSETIKLGLQILGGVK